MVVLIESVVGIFLFTIIIVLVTLKDPIASVGDYPPAIRKKCMELGLVEERKKRFTKKILPDPDGSKIADSVIAEYYRQSVPESIPLTGFDEKLQRRQELLAVIERMDTEKKQIEQELKLYLGEAELAENEHYRVSWKTVSSNRLDEKRLKEEQPEIYEKYRKETMSRRFLIKAA